MVSPAGVIKLDCCHVSQLPSPAGTCRTIRCKGDERRGAPLGEPEAGGVTRIMPYLRLWPMGQPIVFRAPRRGGPAVMETMREFAAMAPWRSIRHSFNLVGSHDTTRIRTLVGENSRQVDVAAGLLFTMPGIPMMTYGDEIGMRGEFGEDGRRPMPWKAVKSEDDEQSDADRWDARLLEVYRGLISARNLSHALRHGGLRWVHADDVLVILRESTEQRALVHCARAAHA